MCTRKLQVFPTTLLVEPFFLFFSFSLFVDPFDVSRTTISVLMIHRHARASNSQSQNDERFFSSFSYAFIFSSLLSYFVYLFIFFFSSFYIFMFFFFCTSHTTCNENARKSHFFSTPTRSICLFIYFFYHFFFFLFFNIFVKQDCKTLYYCNCIMAMIVRRFGSADANCPHLNISRYISRQLTV